MTRPHPPTPALGARRVRASTPPAEHARRLERLRRWSQLLDAAWRVPGTRIRVGLDSLVGFVPGIGDAAGLGASLYLIWQARALGVTAPTLRRMVFNVALESAVGVVPLVGDLFDIGFKANLRNLALIDAELGATNESRPMPGA